MSNRSGQKGKRAEREVVKLLQPIVDAAYHQAGKEPPLLQRTSYSASSLAGGADLMGVPFLAIEVKHRESYSIPSWWKQTCEQAQGRLPILFYRRNNVEFRCQLIWDSKEQRMRNGVVDAPCDLPLWAGKVWLYHRLCEHLGIERKNEFEKKLTF